MHQKGSVYMQLHYDLMTNLTTVTHMHSVISVQRMPCDTKINVTVDVYACTVHAAHKPTMNTKVKLCTLNPIHLHTCTL